MLPCPVLPLPPLLPVCPPLPGRGVGWPLLTLLARVARRSFLFIGPPAISNAKARRLTRASCCRHPPPPSPRPLARHAALGRHLVESGKGRTATGGCHCHHLFGPIHYFLPSEPGQRGASTAKDDQAAHQWQGDRGRAGVSRRRYMLRGNCFSPTPYPHQNGADPGLRKGGRSDSSLLLPRAGESCHLQISAAGHLHAHSR